MNFKIKSLIIGASILAFNQLPAGNPQEAIDTIMKDHIVYQIPQDVLIPTSKTDPTLIATPAAHMGHLLSHVLWVTLYLNDFMKGLSHSWIFPGYCQYEELPPVTIGTETGWCRNFTEKEKALLFIAALLHDVGKAGDPRYSRNKFTKNAILSTGKKDHELIGFYYILHDILTPEELTETQNILQKKYVPKYKIDSSCFHGYRLVPENFFSDPSASLPSFNFKILFEALGLTQEEQKLIAFLIGAHKIFTELYAWDLTDVSGNPTPISFDEFFEFLSDLKIMAKLEQPISEKLLEMVIALTVADFYGVFFPYPEPVFDPTGFIDEKYRPFLTPRRDFFGEDLFRAKEKIKDENGNYQKDAQGRDIEIAIPFKGGELGRRHWYCNRAVRAARIYREETLARVRAFTSNSVE